MSLLTECSPKCVLEQDALPGFSQDVPETSPHPVMQQGIGNTFGPLATDRILSPLRCLALRPLSGAFPAPGTFSRRVRRNIKNTLSGVASFARCSPRDTELFFARCQTPWNLSEIRCLALRPLSGATGTGPFFERMASKRVHRSPRDGVC